MKKQVSEVERFTKIKDRLSLRVSVAMGRWAHRKNGGQSGRTIGSARAEARKAMIAMGFSDAEATVVIKDVIDMVKLERIAEDE